VFEVVVGRQTEFKVSVMFKFPKGADALPDPLSRAQTLLIDQLGNLDHRESLFDFTQHFMVWYLAIKDWSRPAILMLADAASKEYWPNRNEYFSVRMTPFVAMRSGTTFYGGRFGMFPAVDPPDQPEEKAKRCMAMKFWKALGRLTLSQLRKLGLNLVQQANAIGVTQQTTTLLELLNNPRISRAPQGRDDMAVAVDVQETYIAFAKTVKLAYTLEEVVKPYKYISMKPEDSMFARTDDQAGPGGVQGERAAVAASQELWSCPNVSDEELITWILETNLKGS